MKKKQALYSQSQINIYLRVLTFNLLSDKNIQIMENTKKNTIAKKTCKCDKFSEMLVLKTVYKAVMRISL